MSAPWPVVNLSWAHPAGCLTALKPWATQALPKCSAPTPQLHMPLATTSRAWPRPCQQPLQPRLSNFPGNTGSILRMRLLDPPARLSYPSCMLCMEALAEAADLVASVVHRQEGMRKEGTRQQARRMNPKAGGSAWDPPGLASSRPLAQQTPKISPSQPVLGCPWAAAVAAWAGDWRAEAGAACMMRVTLSALELHQNLCSWHRLCGQRTGRNQFQLASSRWWSRSRLLPYKDAWAQVGMLVVLCCVHLHP